MGLLVSLDSGGGVLSSSGFLLSSKLIRLSLVSLGDVDGFNKDGLILEEITLRSKIEFVVSFS